MKKRIGSLLLILALCFTLLPTAALATDNSADTWDGTADTNWYVGHEADTEYHITTAEQLAGLAQLVNADPGTTNFAGKTFYLKNDLDLSGHEWISIGTAIGGDKPKYSFCGVFDGQGHVISNLYSHESYIEGADESHNLLRNALFGSVYNGEVKNLGVANAEIWIDPKDDSAAGKGILVDWMGKSKITNCWTSGSIYSGTKIEKNIGGIVGVTVQGCTISGCYSTATLTGNFTNSEGYYTNPEYMSPDTIGGIVGARFDGSLTVTDCWFGGKIAVNSIQAAVGGIVGYAEDDYYSNENRKTTIRNCLVTTKDLGADEDGNTCWVGYLVGPNFCTAEKNYWPDDEKTYEPSPLREITSGLVSNESQGTAVSDFTSANVLTGLNTNAAEGIEWVAGIKHPTFAWDDNNILADYTAVDAAIASAATLDSSLYTNYSAVEDSIRSVDRAKSKAQQTEVDAMAQAIENAIVALQYKDADYTKVDEAITKANALNKNDYKDFSGVEAAINAVVRGKNITEQDEVDAMAQAIEKAINDLVRRSSGGSSSPSYSVTIPNKTENGTVTVSPRSAEKGDTVTITAKPDSGYQLDDLTVTDKNGKELKLTDKGNGKYTFTMPASKVEVNATFVKEVETSPFSDVSTSAYYYEAVKWAQEKGITGGIGNGLFGPNQPCTRAQIVTFLWRAAGSPEPKAMSSFADVSTDAYYAKAVAWAVENGITTGTGDGKFSPDATCTRAQSVTFLFRAIGKLVDSKAEFSDVLTDSYYANAVAWAVENGVTNGIGDGLFGPDNSCTRAQIVTFLFRAYQGK